MQRLIDYFRLTPETLDKLILTISVLFVLTLAKFIGNLIVKRRVPDDMKAYHWRRALLYSYTVLLIILIGLHLDQGTKVLDDDLGVGQCRYRYCHA
jgi:TRAP-type C4-dicarboxylate transport system permease large subunit